MVHRAKLCFCRRFFAKGGIVHINYIQIIIIIVAEAIVAYKKGFNPLLWIFAGGLIGFFILLTTPSATEAGLSVKTMNKRKKRGNNIGIMMSIATIVILSIIFLKFPHLLWKLGPG
jgi:accessory gene regulator protein AgrB